MPYSRRSRAPAINIWPGFVDALTQLTMVIVFVLMIFTIGQYYLSGTLGDRDDAIRKLTQQLNQLNDMLGVETRGNETLKATIASLSADKKAAEATRDDAVSKQTGTASDLATAQTQLATLNQNVDALRQQLTEISAALDLAKKDDADQKAEITDLGAKLNAALASKAEELARYRSEFFGDIKQILGDRPDIRIVGDRFVFQSEVLFPPGSDTFEATAQQQLAPVVKALKTIAGRIPDNLNWILEVDGFTDKRPINTPDFHSNWELSTARAVSVVKYLIDQGVAPEHLAASGFGEFQPLEPGDTETDYRKNRRIELKLTQR